MKFESRVFVKGKAFLELEKGHPSATHVFYESWHWRKLRIGVWGRFVDYRFLKYLAHEGD